MSDRTFATPFLITPPGRAPAAGGAWSVPNGRKPERRHSVWAMIKLAWHRHRTRLALAQLDGRLLKDIGLTYAEAEHEVNKPFWLR